MPCNTIPAGKGGYVVVCTGRQRRTRCDTPGCGRWTEALCDYPVVRNGKPGTCDRKMCDRCRTKKGENIDHCPPHVKAPAPTGDPQRGEARIHIQTGRTLYVVRVDEHEGAKHVTFSTRPPDAEGRCGGVLQTVELEKWNAKTKAP